MDIPEDISPELIDYLKTTYRLNWDGIHGWQHWLRVHEYGMRMAALNGANTAVVGLFAFTHDMARESDGRDRQHGPRAAKRIREELQGHFFTLAAHELDLLLQAIAGHTFGKTEADITVQTCWDADRLDLGRVGIIPNTRYLCTPQAKDPLFREWAYARSIGL